jgi:hypothetical protein
MESSGQWFQRSKLNHQVKDRQLEPQIQVEEEVDHLVQRSTFNQPLRKVEPNRLKF